VVSACTGAKIALVRGERVPAERLYAGQQHRRLMQGVDAFRASPTGHEGRYVLDLWIVSAGHGLVRGSERLASYDATFAGMTRRNARAHAGRLRIAQSLRRLLSAPFSLALLLLGDDYVCAADLDNSLELGGPTLAFCGRRTAVRLRAISGLRTVLLGTAETRRFRCGLVGLKGEMAGRLLTRLAESPNHARRVSDPAFDVLKWLDRSQQSAPASAAA
jgi:hypothetical protein